MRLPDYIALHSNIAIANNIVLLCDIRLCRYYNGAADIVDSARHGGVSTSNGEFVFESQSP